MAVVIVPAKTGTQSPRGKLAPSSTGPGGIVASLRSLDDGRYVQMTRTDFLEPPSESDRSYETAWDDASVAHAAPQFLEYRDTRPETRVYRCVLNAYDRPGGVRNNAEPLLELLKSFTLRAPGKARSHRCQWIQGAQRFKCIVRSINVRVVTIGTGGGTLQAPEVTITLAELRE